MSLDPTHSYQSTDPFLATTIDPVNGKILAVIRDARDPAAILLRCNLDGSSCTHTFAASYDWGEPLLFVQSEEAGKELALLYSLVVSCDRLGKNPVTYLTDVLSRRREELFEAGSAGVARGEVEGDGGRVGVDGRRVGQPLRRVPPGGR